MCEIKRSEFWQQPTAHREYWERHNNVHVYEYDPTDDGPEVEIIRPIRAIYRDDELLIESVAYRCMWCECE